MQKVGIVTYYSIYNYGSVMQAYALSETIKKMGYEAVLIDHANLNKKWNKKIRFRVLRDRLIQLLTHPLYIYNTVRIKNAGKNDIVIRSLDQDKKFDEFLDRWFKYPETDYTKDNSYVAFICGSDQVWQLSLPGLHYVFFLRFCDKKKRISYAASFGATSIPDYNKKLLKKYLNDFSYISVRERIGVDIVEKNSENKALQVLDPVLLVGREFWDRFTEKYVIDIPYLVAYFLSNPDGYIDEIRDYANKYDLKIVWISTGYEKTINGEDIIEPAPREFIDVVRNAQFVCTDSLHGTEFAIIFHKQFITFPRKYKIVPEQHSRILSLLELTGMNNRLYEGNNCNWSKTIDYQIMEMNLEKMRKKSLEFLKTALTFT